MAWQLTAPQCFFIAIIAFGVFGFQRGWRREMVSLAFTLACILFLIFGNQGLAQFVFINLPRATTTLLTGGASSSQSAPIIQAGDPRIAVSTGIAFVVMIVAGYLISYRIFDKPKTSAERFFGVIPGVISGYAILTFVTNAFRNTSLFSVGVSTPPPSLIGSYLLVIFVVIVVAVIVGLIAASSKKSGGASPPKKP